MKNAIAILSALFLLTQGTAMADREGQGRPDGSVRGYGIGYYGYNLTFDATLNLTAEQAARIRVLDERYVQDVAPVRAQLRDKGHELKSEWLQTEPDRGRIAGLQKEVAKLQKQIREKIAGHRAEVLNILTPEQRAKVPDSRPERGFHRQAGFGRH